MRPYNVKDTETAEALRNYYDRNWKRKVIVQSPTAGMVQVVQPDNSYMNELPWAMWRELNDAFVAGRESHAE